MPLYPAGLHHHIPFSSCWGWSFMQDRQNLQSSYIPAIFQTNDPKYLGSPYQYTTLSVRKRISGRYCYSSICKCVVASESIMQSRGRTAVLLPSVPPAAGTSWGDWLAPIVMLLPPPNMKNCKANNWEITAGLAFLTVLPFGGLDAPASLHNRSAKKENSESTVHMLVCAFQRPHGIFF